MIRQNLRPGELEVHRVDRRHPGRALGPLHAGTPARTRRRCRSYLDTPDRRKRSDVQIVNALRPRFTGEFPGTLTYFNLGGHRQPRPQPRLAEPPRGGGAGLRPRRRPGVAREVARVMRDVEGVADVQISREGNYPQFSVVVDREKAATAGL